LHACVANAVFEFLQLGGVALDDSALGLGEAGELFIMENHRFPIGGKLEIAFYGIVFGNGCSEGRLGVFQNACGLVVQATMGDGPGRDPA
jgi:hypothetical protein